MCYRRAIAVGTVVTATLVYIRLGFCTSLHPSRILHRWPHGNLWLCVPKQIVRPPVGQVFSTYSSCFILQGSLNMPRACPLSVAAAVVNV